MPVSLQETIGDLISSYLTVRDNPSKDATKDLRNVVAQLVGAMKAMETAVKSDDLNEKGPEHDKQIKKIEDAITIEGISDLSQFFTGVTQAVVDAQTDLNRQSISYIQQLPHDPNGHPLIPPSFFAIPSVKAEMKVGVSQIKGKGINVIIFNKQQQRNDYSESTITFEVVSAPAAPGAPLPAPTSPPSVSAPPPKPKPPLVGPRSEALSFPTFSALMLNRGVESPPQFESPPTADEFGASVFDVAERVLALGEREHELDIREHWLDVRADLLGNRAMILGDKSVLDFIRRELRGTDQELGKLYDNTEDLALILSYTRQGKTGYLVLWPGRAENVREDSWRELRVFHLIRVGSALAFDTSIFDRTPPDGFLRLTTHRDLLALTPEEIADTAINLGDVLMKIILIFNEWLKTE